MLYVLDTETNGLLDELDRMWIAVALSVDQSHEVIFCDLMIVEPGSAEVRPLRELPHFMEREADGLIGHNIVGFDLMAIEKVFGYRHRNLDRVYDTMLMSQAQNYFRFGPEAGHSMAVWGRALGTPKQEHEDWTQFSQEMVSRCRSDVRINVKMWHILSKEATRLIKRNGNFAQSLRAEHYASWWVGQCELHGWPFDEAYARELVEELSVEMSKTEKLIEPLLPPRTVVIDPEPRIPKFKTNGDYYAWVCDHFPGLLPSDADDDDAPLQVLGPYQRFEHRKVDLGNIVQVKEYLYSIGWQPDSWNYKRNPDTGKLEKKSPKLSDSSLSKLGEIGAGLITYYTLRSRKSIVEGWLEKCVDGRVHGRCQTIATPTHRARHSIIVNVPSSDALYGKQMRSLFIAPEDACIVGADSSGNQLRGLCHDLNNPEYTHEVVNGDVHTANKNIIAELYPPATRGNAKRFIYAFLFGAGGAKVASDLTGVANAEFGNKLKQVFKERVVGLGPLISRLEIEYEDTLAQYGYGRISAIDGRPIFCDSKRKALNYRLQSTEGITCKLAIMHFVRGMNTHMPEVKWSPLIFMHDEFQLMIDEEFSEEAAKLAKAAFREGPKLAGVVIMDGESKIGNNWYETH